MPSRERRTGNAHSPLARAAPHRRGGATATPPIASDPRRWTAAQLIYLQRMAGNQAVVQRITGKASALAEEQCVVVGAGKQIKYTPLAAGCMAVTVSFAAGGGAGVHLAMLPTHGDTQWTDFVAAIVGQTITAVHLDSDAWGGTQGWRVNATSTVPRSTAELVNTWMMPLNTLNGAGWHCDLPSMRTWFQGALGRTPAIHDNDHPRYTL